jgi:hypothetical protein
MSAPIASKNLATSSIDSAKVQPSIFVSQTFHSAATELDMRELVTIESPGRERQ